MTAAPTSRFAPGARVRVRAAYPPGHVRTPHFVRGHTGTVESIAAIHPNPEMLAYGLEGRPEQAVYRVLFRQTELWTDYAGPPQDTAIMDIFEHWLEPAEGGGS